MMQASIYPKLALKAISQKAGGAIRVWILAKAIDRKWGSGLIYADTLTEKAQELGVNLATFYRWRKQAIDLGLLTCHGGRIGIRGYRKVAEIFNAQNVGRWRLDVNIEPLFRRKWRAWIWKLYESLNGNEPRIRSTKAYDTGIKKRTQQHYHKQAQLRRIPNYVITTKGADHVRGMREHTNHKGAFSFRDKLTDGQKAAYEIGSTVKAKAKGTKARGQTRKINRTLSCSMAGEKIAPITKTFRNYSKASRSKTKATERLFPRFRGFRSQTWTEVGDIS